MASQPLTLVSGCGEVRPEQLGCQEEGILLQVPTVLFCKWDKKWEKHATVN